ncbi:hypothetical protein BE20_00085 [Sorangium cellulosum]|nr:hypothetical protein BE20_00085 [Sorangium cellulosum]
MARELHRRLLETTARWPITAGESEFRRGLCRDLGLLKALCGEDGPAALEDVLRLGTRGLGDGEVDLLHRCGPSRTGSARPRRRCRSWLRSAGWEAERIANAVQFPRGLPRIRLRHPVRMWTGEERTLYGHSARKLLSTLEGHAGGVRACATRYRQAPLHP